MARVATAPPRFDSGDVSVFDDPYPAYARLRAHGPLCRFVPRAWGVTRHAEVTALLRDPGLDKFFLPEEFYRRAAGSGPAIDFFQRMDIGRGDPRVRRVLTHALSAAASRRSAPHIKAVVDRMLEPLLDGAPVDVVAGLARPVVLAVLSEMIGISADARTEVRGRVDALVGFGDLSTLGTQTVAAANIAVERLRELVGAGLHDRFRRPGDDLLSRLAEVADDEEVRRRAVDDVAALLYAGLDTTTNLIVTGCAALAGNPGEFARLRAEPAAAVSAVEEFVRYDAPIQVTPRMVREPVQVGGRNIRQGRVLVLMLGCANRDERVFRDPARLDILRHPNPHVSFGGGGFYCFGAAAARTNAALVFEQLARRCVTLEPAGPPVRARQSTFRSYSSLPVTLTAA